MAETTILGYATKQRNDAKAAMDSAQQRLIDAQASITAQSDAVASATTALTDLDKQAAEIRQKLSVIPTPADGDALIAALEQATIQSRTAQASIVSAQAALLVAQADTDRAQDDMTSASAQLTKAEADLKQVVEANKQRAAKLAALGATPLSKINTDAGKALDETTLPEGDSYRKAKARIASDIPDKLMKRAQNRRDNATARLTQLNSDVQAADDARLKELNDNGGPAGVARKTWQLFQQLAAAVDDFTGTAQTRFDQAQGDLARIADPANSPLTAEQTANVTAPNPLKKAREDAGAAEKTRDDLLKDVASKRALRDAAILKAIVDDKPANKQAVIDKQQDLDTAQGVFDQADKTWRAKEIDLEQKQAEIPIKQTELAAAIQKAIAAKKNPETEPGVVTARDNLKKAKEDLAAAEIAYQKSEHGILHAWEAAVPNTTWRLFEDLDTAEETLKTLRDSDPAKLKTDLLQAEADYVAAQLAADARAGLLLQLVGELARREAARESERQIGPSRRFGALRGDN